MEFESTAEDRQAFAPLRDSEPVTPAEYSQLKYLKPQTSNLGQTGKYHHSGKKGYTRMGREDITY